MEAQLIHSLTGSFESFSFTTDEGIEFWFARDLQQILGYSKWDNFQNVIMKAKTACEISGQDVDNHFADIGKMIQMPKGAKKEIRDMIYECVQR